MRGFSDRKREQGIKIEIFHSTKEYRFKCINYSKRHNWFLLNENKKIPVKNYCLKPQILLSCIYNTILWKHIPTYSACPQLLLLNSHVFSRIKIKFFGLWFTDSKLPLPIDLSSEKK